MLKSNQVSNAHTTGLLVFTSETADKFDRSQRACLLNRSNYTKNEAGLWIKNVNDVSLIILIVHLKWNPN